MSSIRATESQLRKLQKQRHMYDILQMILANPILKNLGSKDQKKLQKILYKAEMIEVFMRDKQLIRVNESFDDIVNNFSKMLDDALEDDDDNDEYR
jgi:Mlc titration factor MtfA (ptsG expression regulator)